MRFSEHFAALGVRIDHLNNPPPIDLSGKITTRSFRNRSIIGYHYILLKYEDVMRRKHSAQTYEKYVEDSAQNTIQ